MDIECVVGDWIVFGDGGRGDGDYIVDDGVELLRADFVDVELGVVEIVEFGGVV